MWKQSDKGHRLGPARRRPMLWNALLAVFLLGSLFCSYLFYASVRDIVAYSNLPLAAGGLSIVGGAPAIGLADSAATPVPDTSGDSRLTILLLGIDARNGSTTPCRTDTMILFSVDPVSKTVSMLSIPRDLWVPLPPGASNRGYDRINTAHFYGEADKYPGGGPALAKEAVQYNLGVPVQYYVRINFSGFQKIIDEIGGIDIEVPRDIVDTQYPVSDDEVMTLRIPAGWQHMDGDLALKYARTRHDSSDLDRARRQQQVIMAVRDKVLSLNIPLTRIPGLLLALGDSVSTDIPLDKIYTLAQVARQVQTGAIQQAVIDETMVTPWVTPGGADVLLPQRDKIRALVEKLFPMSPVTTAMARQPGKLAQEVATPVSP